jgi:hypothetical protein
VTDEEKELLHRVEAARALLGNAERELERALGLTEVAARSAKVIIDASLETAFSKLRAAQADLADLEGLIGRGKP